MQLPNATEARVEERKVTRYLLNADHPDNGGKARFFRGLGYEPARWRELAKAFCRHAEDQPVARTEVSPYGMKYVIEGPLRSPNARRWVRAIWMIDDDETVPRLVTAYPVRSPDDR